MLGKFLKSHKHDMGIEFPYDAQEGDAPAVVAVASVTLILVEGDDLGMSPVLWHGSRSANTGKGHHEEAAGGYLCSA